MKPRKPKPLKVRSCKRCGQEALLASPGYCPICGPIVRNERRQLFLQENYGITIKCVELMMEKQGGRCGICGRLFDNLTWGDGRKGKISPAIDHDHKTGKVRGLLCWKCNTGLGSLGDSVDGLKKALEYLER